MQLLPLHATVEQGGAHNILVYRGTPFSTQSSKTLHAKLELYVEEGLAISHICNTHAVPHMSIYPYLTTPSVLAYILPLLLLHEHKNTCTTRTHKVLLCMWLVDSSHVHTQCIHIHKIYILSSKE